LKWKKEKYKIGDVKQKSIEEAGKILNIEKNSFGIQIKENSFIVC
jgi:hypothetical protein